MSSINSVNTKLEAYLLVHNPNKLLRMLSSKYSDIEEDRNFFYINQIFYNKKSALNTLFKEYQYFYNYDDFLKRFYYHDESINRIPKLSDYYKNYYLFFCKPFFRNLKMTKILQSNGNLKAEIFYKNNYESLSKNDDETEKIKENSLISFDNTTNNKTIFDQKIKNVIENSSSKMTLSLENSEINKTKYNLFTKRSKDDSFSNILNDLLNNRKELKDDNLNKNNLYFPQKQKFSYKNKIKSSIYNLSKNSYLNSFNIDKNKKSLSPSFYHNPKANFEEFYRINKIHKKNIKMNKTTNKKNNNSKNLNSNLSNFEKLSSTLNNNHNNGNISKTMRNNLTNKNNKMIYHEKISSRQFLIPNTYSTNSNSKNKIIKSSNVTFEKNNSPKKTEKIPNSNFLLFNSNNNSTIKTQKRNFGSKFNLVKTSLQAIQPNFNKETIFNSQKISNFTYKKNQTYFSSKTNNNSNVSLSLKKSKKKKENTIRNEKLNKNPIKRRNKSNLENLAFSNRRNLKNYINSKIFYPPNNNINNYRIYMKLNNINISSRNQKDSISNNQTNIKSLRKENKINTNSIDEDKFIVKNILSNLEQRKYKSEISQKIINQLDELMNKNKFTYYNRLNNNTMSSPNLNNEKQNQKISENHHNGKFLIIKKNKHMNLNFNQNLKVGSKEKNEKIKRIFSSKK